jgi:hypothetical protein
MVYDQFENAFANISAYLILQNGEKIGKLCFKYSSGSSAHGYLLFTYSR